MVISPILWYPNDTSFFCASASTTVSGWSTCYTGYGANTSDTAGVLWYNPVTVNASASVTFNVTWPQAYPTLGTSPFYDMQVIYGQPSTMWSVPDTPEMRAEIERRRVKEDAAMKRAEEMLFLLLSDGQRQQYLKDGYFEVEINDKMYRINKGRSMNVELMENGKPKFKYCALPKDYLPAPDVMAAQLLMLRTDERKFLSIANRTILHPD